jgi:hypothetical protein|tara:strand:+ start:238 stop:2070 length:1833 start_codon:yes stop_codon:yes gene_type:complete
MANYRKSFNFRNGVQVDDDNLVVNANGLVGIGTTIPTELLDVRGIAKVVGLVTASSGIIKNLEVTGVTTITSGSIGNLNVDAAGIATAVSGVVTYYGDGSNLTNIPTSQWVTVSGSIYRKTGFVGIATNNPQMDLQVGGNPLLAGTLPGGVGVSSLGHIKATGVVTATQLVADKFTGAVTGNINSTGVSTFTDVKIGSNITATLGVVTATTFVGGLTGTVTGDVVGIATTARGLIGSPNITVGTITATEITATTLNLPTAGIVTAQKQLNVGTGGTVFTVADTNNKAAFGAASPDANLEIRTASGLSSVHIRNTGGSSVLTLGRGTPTETTSGGVRFGGDNTLSYSDSRSFDLVNYDLGNLNYILHGGSGTGINTGGFHWFKGTTPLMSLSYGGNLGLGVTAPTQKFSVSGISTFSGNSFFTGDVSIVGGLTITSTLSATSFKGDILAPNGAAVVIDTGSGTGVNGRSHVNTYVTSGVSTFSNTITNSTAVFASTDTQGTTRADGNALKFAINPPTLPGGSGSPRIAITQKGCIGSGTTNPQCALDLGSATANDSGESYSSDRFMILPKVTTTNRGNLNNLTAGAVIYNTTLNKIQVYNGSAWETVTSST